MSESEIQWADDGKYYASTMISSFTLRRGYLRIDYSPTAFGPGSITFTRETCDPTDYCDEISAGTFRELRSQVMATLNRMVKSKASEELPELHIQDDEESDDDLDDMEIEWEGGNPFK